MTGPVSSADRMLRKCLTSKLDRSGNVALLHDLRMLQPHPPLPPCGQVVTDNCFHSVKDYFIGFITDSMDVLPGSVPV